MTGKYANDWKPDPQMLAAYFDGEMEGRNELAELRARVEAWLEAHPEMLDEWHAHKQLQKLWLSTTPIEPLPAVWDAARHRACAKQAKRAIASRRRLWAVLGGIAAGVVLVISVWLGLARRTGAEIPNIEPIAQTPKSQPEPDDVFSVAVEAEITILRVEGADTNAVAVGALPFDGVLELADPGDVLVYERPDSLDRSLMVRQAGPNRPVIWARIDTE